MSKLPHRTGGQEHRLTPTGADELLDALWLAVAVAVTSSSDRAVVGPAFGYPFVAIRRRCGSWRHGRPANGPRMVPAKTATSKSGWAILAL